MGILSLITGKAGASGFGSSSTSEHVTEGVDASRLTVIVTGIPFTSRSIPQEKNYAFVTISTNGDANSPFLALLNSVWLVMPPALTLLDGERRFPSVIGVVYILDVSLFGRRMGNFVLCHLCTH
jgi:hypothetical protein